MKASGVTYWRADSVDAALGALRGSGGAARLLAGGQSLVASLNLRLADEVALIDINGLAELEKVEDAGELIRIGALTRHRTLETSPLVAEAAPALAQAAPLIAHAAIRTRGTIGGSLSYADPAAELPACLVALEAEIVARSAGGSRRIPAHGFFKGVFETALAEDEMIEAVEVPKAGPAERQVVMELARRSGDYALAGVVLRADVDSGRLSRPRVAYFGLGPVPALASGAMAALEAGDLDAAVAALGQDLDPSSDLHASGEYRLHLAGVLLRRAVARARGEGGPA
jgi:aerobic carbon-monoxide dehydrogenase medium subunit